MAGMMTSQASSSSAPGMGDEQARGIGRDLHALQRGAVCLFNHGDGQHLPQELYAFVQRVVVLKGEGGDAFAAAAIHDRDLLRAEAFGGTGGVDGGVPCPR